MQTSLIALPHLHTVTTGKGESLADLVTTLAPEHLSNQQLVQMEQVHGAEVAVFTTHKGFETAARNPTAETPVKKLSSNEPLLNSLRLPGVDAVLTSLPNLMLVVRTADCVPILLAHPSGVIGAIHAGRRGTQQKILQKTLKLLKETWSITESLHVWIGPHICAKCYETNRQTGEHYDLLTENLKQLHAEFAPESITLTLDGRCTAHHNNELYSYRREGVGVPMNYSGIKFKS
jgi:polyphenol oxidase